VLPAGPPVHRRELPLRDGHGALDPSRVERLEAADKPPQHRDHDLGLLAEAAAVDAQARVEVRPDARRRPVERLAPQPLADALPDQRLRHCRDIRLAALDCGQHGVRLHLEERHVALGIEAGLPQHVARDGVGRAAEGARGDAPAAQRLRQVGALDAGVRDQVGETPVGDRADDADVASLP
jgi:hypothetical protein